MSTAEIDSRVARKPEISGLEFEETVVSSKLVCGVRAMTRF